MAEEATVGAGADIIRDRLSFASTALPQLATLRDRGIALASEMSSVISNAKREHDRASAFHTPVAPRHITCIGI
eukprot:1482155-Prymnesium_polylepis.1